MLRNCCSFMPNSKSGAAWSSRSCRKEEVSTVPSSIATARRMAERLS